MKNKRFVIYGIDVESTGINPDIHEIIEVSLYRLSDDAQKTWYLKPKHPENAEPEALRVNGAKLEDLKHLTKFGVETYIDQQKSIVDMENWINEDGVSAGDRVFLAQNAQFDISFMEALWRNNNSSDTFPFGKRPLVLDTKQIALFLDLCFDTSREFYNLGSLVADYGVKKEKAHKAATDTRACKNVFLAEVETVRKLSIK